MRTSILVDAFYLYTWLCSLSPAYGAALNVRHEVASASTSSPAPLTCGREITLKDLDTLGPTVDEYWTQWWSGVTNNATQKVDMDTHADILAYFGHMHWTNAFFSCDLEDGCRHGPASCDDILAEGLENRQGRTDEEIVKEAKIVYLLYLKIETVNMVMKRSRVCPSFPITQTRLTLAFRLHSMLFEIQLSMLRVDSWRHIERNMTSI